MWVEELMPPQITVDADLSGPAFLPPLVLSVTVVQADIDIEIENGFGFDPLRPAFGIDGRITRTFSVDPGTIEAAVWVEAYVISPGGDLVVLDASDRIRAGGAMMYLTRALVATLLGALCAGPSPVSGPSRWGTSTTTPVRIFPFRSRRIGSRRSVLPGRRREQLVPMSPGVAVKVQGGDQDADLARLTLSPGGQ